MNLKHLSKPDLLFRTKQLAFEERRITNELLHHLIEIESRMLHVELGYTSLHLYVTKELRFSDASAQRRIDAARLLRQVPAIETQLATGDLILGSVGKAQQFFRAERKRGVVLSASEKEKVMLSLVGLSVLEVEGQLAEKNPDAFPVEKVRATSVDTVAITFTTDRELRQKLERVRKLYSNTNPNLSYAEMIEMLAEFYIGKKEKSREPIKAETGGEKSSVQGFHLKEASSLDLQPQRRNDALPLKRQAILAHLQRDVRTRDKNRCVWILPNGQKCGSQWQLELDHIKPHALGGTSTAANLRCLCRQHNMLAAQRVFGRDKMKRSETLHRR